MTRCGCQLVEFGIAPFFIFYFLFLFLKNTPPPIHTTFPHKRSLVDQLSLQLQHFAHCSYIRCPPTRSCPLVRSARSPVAHVPVARGTSTFLFTTWSPASQSRYNTVLQFFCYFQFLLVAIARRRDQLLNFYKTNNCNSQGLCLSKISDREFTNGATASSSMSMIICCS